MATPLIELHTPRLRIILPPEEHAPQLLAYYRDNREHLARSAPAAPDDFYTLGYWRRRLRRGEREYEEDRSLRLVAFDRADPGVVVGTLSFTELIRGALQSCNLGYGIAARFEGQGLMREALEATIPYVFEELGVHRITAGYLPTNHRSGGLLRRLGFHVEGYARDYLFIGGQWRDHLLAALVNPTPRAPALRRTARP